MNNILKLKGNEFIQEASKKGFPKIEILKTSVVELSRLKRIHASLLDVKKFWEDINIIDGVLISVYYDRIVAKSNRIQGYLKGKSSDIPNETIVGAKFDANKTKHIITHYITRATLDKTIRTSAEIINFFESSFPSGLLDYDQFSSKETFDNLNYDSVSFAKNTFKQYLRDSCFVEKFGIEQANKKDLRNSIVTFYNVNTNISDVLKKIDINVLPSNILGQTTVLLDEKNVNLVFARAPYLVSMAVADFTELSPEDLGIGANRMMMQIPSPKNEPTIGVIDTLFERNVYFSDWVEYPDLIPEEINKEEIDYQHGTAVSSLIVDAPRLNPNLDDGCGRFQVRHFGVSLHSGFNSFTIIKKIREIVSQNTDIKVWNLSLGSNYEVKNNFISVEAAVLDDIQYEYDVIFVIAGTNASNNTPRKRIGSPADSLNSVVVNSVDFNNDPVEYSRQGIVLSFFIKPDIAYYGGGNGDFINVCEPLGLAKVAGTSFAAPLIARKLAYLIYIMGLNREEAKALLIDSAIGWENKKSFEEMTLMGNGVVPVKIKDILETPEDEIKFIVSDVSEKYESYNYNFPVPISKGKYPFVARATMCYFPKCSRNQGVDYTDTELNLTFGRLTSKKDKPSIVSINKDRQNLTDAPAYIKEESARKLFRKWDNIKHVGETFTIRKKAKAILNNDNPQWGMSVKTIERLGKRENQNVRFGVVVTLKEINGINRIEEFINQAELRGWLVNQLQVQVQVGIYNKMNEDIKFE